MGGGRGEKKFKTLEGGKIKKIARAKRTCPALRKEEGDKGVEMGGMGREAFPLFSLSYIDTNF